MKLRWLIIAVLALSLGSCRLLNPSIMFRTDKTYDFNIPPDTLSGQYKISPNDFISFQLFANDGFKIVDMLNNSSQTGGAGMNMFQMMNNGFNYLVLPDSTVKLPILGYTKIAGKTIREAELYLQDLYTSVYNDPFVIVNVRNRRVLVFSGTDGLGTVVPLTNENITLIEALALAGGITQTGKAHKIKVIRGLLPNKEPEVFLIDLSTIQGLSQADMVMQANDIIYVEPRLYIASGLLREIAPVLTLLTSTTSIITTTILVMNLLGDSNP